MNRMELAMMDSNDCTALPATVHFTMPCIITLHAMPATSADIVYFQIAVIRDETPNPIGRPAYQKAGIDKIQKDKLQARAMPAGPHGNIRTNNKTVAADSISVQRSQRPGFPM